MTSDRVFVKPMSSLPPVGNHYRLKWLEQDVDALIDHTPAPMPQPLDVLPYIRIKDNTACARPSIFLTPDDGRPKKKPKLNPIQIPTEAAVLVDSKERIQDASPHRNQTSNVTTNISASRSHLPNEKLSALPVLSQLSLKQPSTPAGLQNIAKPASIPSVPAAQFRSPAATFASTESRIAPNAPDKMHICTINDSKPSPKHPETRTKHITEKFNDASIDDQHLREDICLQFVSPNDPRLMGSVTYSLAEAVDPKPHLDQVKRQDEIHPSHDDLFEETVQLDDWSLKFRAPHRDFSDSFQDIDIKDELGAEMIGLNNVLNDLTKRTTVLRQFACAKVKSAFASQNQFVSMAEEGESIMARLKEIEAVKAQQATAEKAEKAREKAMQRRLSKPKRSQSKQRKKSSISKVADQSVVLVDPLTPLVSSIDHITPETDHGMLEGTAAEIPTSSDRIGGNIKPVPGLSIGQQLMKIALPSPEKLGEETVKLPETQSVVEEIISRAINGSTLNTCPSPGTCARATAAVDSGAETAVVKPTLQPVKLNFSTPRAQDSNQAKSFLVLPLTLQLPISQSKTGSSSSKVFALNPGRSGAVDAPGHSDYGISNKLSEEHSNNVVSIVPTALMSPVPTEGDASASPETVVEMDTVSSFDDETAMNGVKCTLSRLQQDVLNLKQQISPSSSRLVTGTSERFLGQKDKHDLERMQSPVSPIHVASPGCIFVAAGSSNSAPRGHLGPDSVLVDRTKQTLPKAIDGKGCSLDNK